MAEISLTISLSEPLKHHVDAKVEAGAFETVSAYLEYLIIEDSVRLSPSEVDHILSGIDSPDLDISEEELATRPFGALLSEKLRNATPGA